MTRGTDVLDFYYDASGIPVAFRYNNTTYFYVTTLQGDVLLILDEDGEIVVSYDYDAWGKILAIGGSMATTLGTLNPLTYRGYVYDHETGLYYLQSRYYNPEWGRFLNADALVSTGGLLGNNMFAYCGNNPVNREDPTGHAYCKVYFDSFSPFDTGLVNVAGCAGGSSGFVGGNAVEVSRKANPFQKFLSNKSEQAVIDAKFIAMYKGKLVIKLPIGKNAAFLGIMFIGNGVTGPNVVKHEYGHSLHCDEIGFINYVKNVAIPSVMINLLDRRNYLPYDYYSYSWEAEANRRGGAELSQGWKRSIPENIEVRNLFIWSIVCEVINCGKK